MAWCFFVFRSAKWKIATSVSFWKVGNKGIFTCGFLVFRMVHLLNFSWKTVMICCLVNGEHAYLYNYSLFIVIQLLDVLLLFQLAQWRSWNSLEIVWRVLELFCRLTRASTLSHIFNSWRNFLHKSLELHITTPGVNPSSTMYLLLLFWTIGFGLETFKLWRKMVL